MKADVREPDPLGWGIAQSGAPSTLMARWWKKVDRNVNQDGAEVQGGADAARQELTEMRERMAVIKQEAAVEVDRKWVSPWRTPDVFDLKVKTRLTGNREYRSLQGRVREAEVALAAKPDAATGADSAR
jgi:hypothetical protein